MLLKCELGVFVYPGFRGLVDVMATPSGLTLEIASSILAESTILR